MSEKGLPSGDRVAAEKLVRVSRETWNRLDIFVELLQRWQKATNLIAPSTLPVVWTRHVADSLQLLQHAPGARRWVDLGSGGGFPGVVLAIALAESDGGEVHLIESDARKCAFLREALRVTEARGYVHHGRIAQVLDHWEGGADVVTARALAPLPKLLDLAFPLLKTGVPGLFLKGQDVGDELTQAAKSWMIQARLVPSVTESKAQIVIVEGLARRS